MKKETKETAVTLAVSTVLGLAFNYFFFYAVYGVDVFEKVLGFKMF